MLNLRLYTAPLTRTLLLIALVLGGVNSFASTIRRVEVVPIEARTLGRDIQAVGTLTARDSVVLRAEVAGRIVALNFQEGQEVKQGQIVVQLDDSMADAQVQQAQANLRLTDSQLRRAGQLANQGFISAQAKDEASSKHAVQQAELRLAKVQLDKTQIRAPFTGIAGLKMISVGDYVSPGAELVNIEDIHSLSVDFSVPEQYLAGLKVGMPVSLRLDAFPGEVRMGELSVISPQVDAAARTIRLRARIDNQDGSLRPGLFVRVGLQMGTEQALMVPETALAPAGQQQYIYLVKDGKVSRREITIGVRRDAWVQVIGEALQAGDAVIVSGLQKITDGSPVDVQQMLDVQQQEP